MERIYLSPPHMSGKELRYVRDAFESNYIAPLGPQVKLFEREFQNELQIKNALAVSSGTAALHLGLKCLGISSGDKVVVSTLTFIASAGPIKYLGGEPIFIDSDWHTWNMDPNILADIIKKLVNRNTLPKAVVVTDLYGQSADIDTIKEICDPYEVPILSDSAEALGATYKDKSAGTCGLAGVFSFNGNKIITTSGGGMLVSNDDKIITYARYLSQQAREKKNYYEHKEIGYNYRMSNILAAIGRGQLERLEDKVSAKRSIFDYYHRNLKDLPGITFMPEATYGKSNRWLTVIIIEENKFGFSRDKIITELEKNNIESRPAWKPLHLQPVFQGAEVAGGEVSEKIFSNGICLPSGTQIKKQEINKIVEIIKRVHTKNNRNNL